MNFTTNLISWYKKNKRDLPWRSRKDPYAIWLSEIILQQTRIDQGLAYYESFIQAFPTVFDLAKAEEKTVLKLWQGLGYYTRARNLHHTAKVIAEEFNGNFPASHHELIKLRGIGDYTASAIASICYGEPQPVVDGNVFRVLSRIYGIETPIDSSTGQKEFKMLAQELIDTKHPGEFNQALMEFGATHCTPKKPKCEGCPFQKICVAFQLEKVNNLPFKKGKTKVQNRYYNYLVMVSEDEKTFLEKRTNGIWKNLYQFPLMEKEAVTAISIYEVEKLFPDQKIESVTLYNDKPVIHKLSHRNLYVQFWVVYASALETEGIPVDKINDYPVPVVIQNFIESFAF